MRRHGPAEAVVSCRRLGWRMERGFDPFLPNVELHAAMLGSHGAALFPDSSLSRRQILVYGDAQTSADTVCFGRTAYKQTGTSPNHLEVAGIHFSAGSETLADGAVDFTIECFFWLTSLSGTAIPFSSGCAGSGTGTTQALRQGIRTRVMESSGRLQVIAGNLNRDGASRYYHRETSDWIRPGRWYHVAISCESNVPYVHLDGVLQTLTQVSSYTSTDLANKRLYTTDHLNVGAFGFHNGVTSSGTGSSTSGHAHYSRDFRITRGVTRYPQRNFVVSPHCAFSAQQ